jgi:hypothetical protein
MANAFDEFDSVPTQSNIGNNAFDEFVNTPPTASEVLERQPSMMQRFFEPSIPEPLGVNSLKDIAASGAVGAGVGAALGSPTLVGTGPAAVAGGLLGLTSGAAGEVARSMGASPASTLMAETLGGLGTNVAAKMGKGLIALAPSWRVRQAVKSLPGGRVEENARKVVGEKMFGKDTFNLFNTTENSEATQMALKQQIFGQDLANLGTNIDRKASDILREQLYSSTKNLKQSGNTFSTSPEYTALIDDARALKERGQMTVEELNNLQKIVRLELSKNPKVEPFAQQDMLNLIQNGGVYTVSKKGAEVETKTKIPEGAREKLKERFNEFLQRNLGNKQYEVLKGAERQEFIAEARDALPTLLNEGFKFGTPEFTKIINLVKQSPEGKKDLMGALNQHLNSIEDPQKMLKEWQRIAPGLRELGVLDRQGTADIMKKVSELPKNVDALTRRKNLQNIILFPAVATTGAELQTNDKIPLNPLRMFNM